MPEFKRPDNPQFLIEATYRIFGAACLRCGVERPLDMAHILDWPKCEAFAGEQIEGMKPPRGWHYAVALETFHNITNVVPLCPSCHRLLDQKKYVDVTECGILELRNEAIKRPDVLARVIDFVGTELSGRPNRYKRKMEDGKVKYSPMADTFGALMPLSWVADAYQAGILTDNPHMVVRENDGWHSHVRLEHGSISHCCGSLEDCAAGARVWTRARSSHVTHPG